MKSKIYFIFFIFFGCGSSDFLNLKPQKMSQTPKNIILAQIAGLGVTHLGALRFGLQSDQDVDYSAGFNCHGVVWPQDFTTMRPNVLDSMNSQIFGSKSVDGTCQDYELSPFWDRYLNQDKQVIILEIGSNSETSLENKTSCDGKSILENVTLLKMQPFQKNQKELFDYKNRITFKPGVFYDGNCESQDDSKCQSAAFENIRYVVENGFGKSKNVIFVIRDFNYQKLLNQKKFNDAFAYLQTLFLALQLENFQRIDSQKLLTLILGSSSIEIEFPQSASNWSSILENGRLSVFKYSGLQSLSLARGASAENFCGSFFNSEIVERIFFHTYRKKSTLDLFQGILEW